MLGGEAGAVVTFDVAASQVVAAVIAAERPPPASDDVIGCAVCGGAVAICVSSRWAPVAEPDPADEDDPGEITCPHCGLFVVALPNAMES